MDKKIATYSLPVASTTRAPNSYIQLPVPKEASVLTSDSTSNCGLKWVPASGQSATAPVVDVDLTKTWETSLKKIFAPQSEPFRVNLRVVGGGGASTGGGIANIQFDRVAAAITAANVEIAAAVPREYAPRALLQFPVFVSSDREKMIGLLTVGPDGTVRIYAGMSIAPNTWQPGTMCAIYGTSITYQI